KSLILLHCLISRIGKRDHALSFYLGRLIESLKGRPTLSYLIWQCPPYIILIDPYSPENLLQPSIKLDLTFDRYSGLTKDNTRYSFERIEDNLLLEPRQDIPLLTLNSFEGIHKE